MLAKRSKKRPSQSRCIGRSSSREYQTDPEKQAENSVFEFFNRIGPQETLIISMALRPVSERSSHPRQ
jgi:hypothetical protein